jgi:hypothetical protein
MSNKSLPHIIFNKWTFIDLMSNLMAICAIWKVRFWNSVHTVNSFALIPWNSSNNTSILRIKSRFIIPHFDSHKNSFCIIGFALGKTIVSCLVISTSLTPLDILIP